MFRFASQTSKTRSFQPAFEMLESRNLMAAGAVMTNGLVVVTGTDQDDVINIYRQFGASPYDPELVGVSITTAGNTLRFSFPKKCSLRVDALAGNDRVTNNTANRSTLNGMANNDSLYGGSGNDVLSGGGGNDIIDGRGSTDCLVETADVNMTLTDTTMTGRGADTIVSIESARLTGGTGDNTIDCQWFSGPVTLSGGSGADLLLGGSGDDYLYGNDNADQLFGMGGNDYLEGGSGEDIIDGGRGEYDRAKDSASDEMASLLLAWLAGQPDHGVESWTYT